MALFLFTKAILEGKPIDVYNYGKMQRDFTYVDDIVEGIYKIIIGKNGKIEDTFASITKPTSKKFISALEKALD